MLVKYCRVRVAMALALPGLAGYMSCSMIRRRSRFNEARSSKQGLHVRGAEWGLHHGAALHRLVEADAVGARRGRHGGVDLLEVDVADPVGMALHDLAVVARGVLDVTGVQAQCHRVGVGVLQERVDELLGFDVRVDVRVEAELDVELLLDHSAELVLSVDQVAPLFGGQVGGLVQFAGLQVGEHLRQHHQMVDVHGREQFAHLEGILAAGLERVGPAVGGGPDRARGQRQLTLAEFVGQLVGVGGQVAERAEFDGAESGFDDLVEEDRPVGLLRVIGEPDAPGVRGGAQLQAGVVGVGRDGVGDLGGGHVNVLGVECGWWIQAWAGSAIATAEWVSAASIAASTTRMTRSAEAKLVSIGSSARMQRTKCWISATNASAYPVPTPPPGIAANIGEVGVRGSGEHAARTSQHR